MQVEEEADEKVIREGMKANVMYMKLVGVRRGKIRNQKNSFSRLLKNVLTKRTV